MAKQPLGGSNRFGLLTKEQQEQIDQLINEKNKYYMKVGRLRRELVAARNEINRLKKSNSRLNKRCQDLINKTFKKD